MWGLSKEGKGVLLLRTSFWTLCETSLFSRLISPANDLRAWSPPIPSTCPAYPFPYVFYAVQCQGADQLGHLYICFQPARRRTGKRLTRKATNSSWKTTTLSTLVRTAKFAAGHTPMLLTLTGCARQEVSASSPIHYSLWQISIIT